MEHSFFCGVFSEIWEFKVCSDNRSIHILLIINSISTIVHFLSEGLGLVSTKRKGGWDILSVFPIRP